MNIFDIIGPVMVGPSSSHTAGAVRIGQVSRKLFGHKINNANIHFYDSFYDTGKGHGTDKALIAGLLGFNVDDTRIPDSFRYAKAAGMTFTMSGSDNEEVNPNSVKIILESKSGRTIEIIGSSIGGGRIQINEIDGLPANFSGDYPTLVVSNIDMPGHVSNVTGMLAKKHVNIAAMQLYRASRGGNSVMVLECDEEVPDEIISDIEKLEGIVKVAYLRLE